MAASAVILVYIAVLRLAVRLLLLIYLSSCLMFHNNCGYRSFVAVLTNNPYKNLSRCML